MWRFIVAGATLVGMGLLALRRLVPSMSGPTVTLYQAEGTGSAEFRRAAQNTVLIHQARTYPVRNGSEIRAALAELPQGTRRLIMIGHGAWTMFFDTPNHKGLRSNGPDAYPDWISETTVASMIARKLAPGFIVSLAGCSTAIEPDHLAGKLRDALVRAGAPFGEVRGRLARGSTQGNPHVASFTVAAESVGRPGVAVTGIDQGKEAALWIFGAET